MRNFYFKRHHNRYQNHHSSGISDKTFKAAKFQVHFTSKSWLKDKMINPAVAFSVKLWWHISIHCHPARHRPRTSWKFTWICGISSFRITVTNFSPIFWARTGMRHAHSTVLRGYVAKNTRSPALVEMYMPASLKQTSSDQAEQWGNQINHRCWSFTLSWVKSLSKYEGSNR